MLYFDRKIVLLMYGEGYKMTFCVAIDDSSSEGRSCKLSSVGQNDVDDAPELEKVDFLLLVCTRYNL